MTKWDHLEESKMEMGYPWTERQKDEKVVEQEPLRINFIHSFIHPFHKYILSISLEPDTEGRQLNKKDTAPALRELISGVVRHTSEWC